MPTFAYAGIDTAGQPVQGQILALSEEHALTILEEMRVRAESIKQPWWDKDIGTPKVKKADVANFTGLFASMLRTKMKPREALAELQNDMPSKALRNILLDVRVQVERGRPLAEAMKDHPNAFPLAYTAAVQAAETAGNLREVMSQLAADLKRSEKLKRKLIVALTYPIAVMAIGALVFIGLLYFLIPKLAEGLLSMGATLPKVTLLLLGLSEVVRGAGPIIFVLPVVLGLGFAYLLKTNESFRLKIHTGLLRVPVLKLLLREIDASRYAHLMGTLLGAKERTENAIRLAADTLTNQYIRKVLHEVADGHMLGRKVHEELRRVGGEAVPNMLITMTKVGEEGGNLAEQMSAAGEFFDERVEYFTDQVLAILGPVSIIIAFLPVLVLALGVYAPLVEGIQSVGK